METGSRNGSWHVSVVSEGPFLQMLFVIQQIVALGIEKFNERVESNFKSYLKFKEFLPSKAKLNQGLKIIVLSVIFLKGHTFVTSLGYSFA